jgi:hypothetical protein
MSSARYKLGTKECADALRSLWHKLMAPEPKKRAPKRWRKPRASDAPVGVPEPIESLRKRMWGGDGTARTYTVRGLEAVPVDKQAAQVVRATNREGDQ